MISISYLFCDIKELHSFKFVAKLSTYYLNIERSTLC